MANPILTIRGREISEPTLWAVGGLIAWFTPLPAVAIMPVLIVAHATESGLAAAAMLLAVFGLLTWWARLHPGRWSSRAWSVGAWLVSAPVTFFGTSAMFGLLDGTTVPDWLATAITLVAGLAILGLASPICAFGAFLLGQRFFAATGAAGAPTEGAIAS